MAIVLLIAVGLGLAVPALEVYSAKDYHTHTAIDMRGTPCLTGMGGIEAPFWRRYWRRILGLPWRHQPVCGPTAGFAVELCEFAHPEIRIEVSGRVAYTFTSEQGDRLQALEEQGKVEQQEGSVGP
jgi:hypothetical protein